MADFYGAKNGESFWPDARPAPEPFAMPAPVPEPVPEIEPEPAPVRPSAPTQIPPAVQPLVIVPYVSPMQPLYQYTPEAMREMYANGAVTPPPYPGAMGYPAYPNAYPNAGYPAGGYPTESFDDSFDDEIEEEIEKPIVKAPKAKKRANAMAIIGLILGLIAVAFMVIGYFGFLPETILPFLRIYGEMTVINVIMTDLIDLVQASPIDYMALIVPGLIALSALFTVITLLTNLFSVAAKKYPIAGKVFAWLAFVFAAGAVAYLFIKERESIATGAYVLVGLTLVIAIICTAGRRK